MKKYIAFTLALLLLLAVPVHADSYYIHDDEGLLKDHDVSKLEQVYGDFAKEHGFTPAVVTTSDLGGLPIETFAGQYYDIMGYPADGIMLLISLKEGQWYLLTNGTCHERISNADAQILGEEVVHLVRDGQYYAAFLSFPEKALEIFNDNAPVITDPVIHVEEETQTKSFGKTFAICMGVGMLIGAVAVAIMAMQMKSVRPQPAAADYIIPGSARLTNSRDIFLYARTTRSPKSKPNATGSSHRGGGSRGGAGGRI